MDSLGSNVEKLCIDTIDQFKKIANDQLSQVAPRC